MLKLHFIFREILHLLNGLLVFHLGIVNGIEHLKIVLDWLLERVTLRGIFDFFFVTVT